MPLTLPDLPPTIRPLLTPESQQLRRKYPNIPKSPAECITCKGTKEFLWYAEGRSGTPQVYTCPCFDQFVLHRVMLSSGIPESYQRLGWPDFTLADESAVNTAVDWMLHQDAYVRAGFGLIISGTPGTGKSLLAYLLIKDLMKAGRTCHASTFSNMIELFTKGWTSEEDKAWFNRKVRNADVLLVDDLGREHNKSANSVGNSMVEGVIRDRVNRGLPTFVTTNLSQQDVAHGYGLNTMSLLRERSDFVLMPGVDRREDVKARIKAEILSGVQRPILLS